MSSADFLLELLSEEIPARMQAGARNDLARLFAEELEKAGLSSEAIDVFSTPRRLALVARAVPLETEARTGEIKGPRTSAPPQALDGFLRKTGLKREQLEERDGVYFARVETAGQRTLDLLGPMIERIVRGFPWPKSMRWGEASTSTASLRWVRPLHGIVAMLGEDIVPVSIDGIRSGATTIGHRFHHPGPITVGGAGDYAEKLRACHVIVDQDERERIIRDGAAKAAKDAGLELVADEGLVVENAGLTEWPVPLLGRFEADYLDVPREVIVLTMRANQKYFACTGKDGELAPAFVCIANIDAKDGGKSIVEGNRRVLAARLADARFFWEQDLKVPLEEQAKKLDGIIFHEKLGTLADKVERVAKLARWLVEEGIVKEADPHQVERAARLAKADLVTGMVGEFPELQGVIGGYLARAQGEPDAVADAVRDHYKPVGQWDPAPTAAVTVAVSLADKLDTLVGFFAVVGAPTGSRDPFALRRAAIGTASAILLSGIRLRLGQAIERSAFIWLDVFLESAARADDAFRKFLGERREEGKDSLEIIAALFAPEGGLTGKENVASVTTRLRLTKAGNHILRLALNFAMEFDQPARLLPSFFAERLKVWQRDAGVRYDLIDAVFAVSGEDDLVRLSDRVEALRQFIETEEGADLLTAYKRAANILKKEESTWTVNDIRSDGDWQSEELRLRQALASADIEALAALEIDDFTAAMAVLASLRAPIDSFFDEVTVNVEDLGVRARRLSLLARFRDAVHRVADFSKIEG